MPAEKIVLPPHQGLPFDHVAPEVDGFCEWEGIDIPDIEGGWKGAARVSFGQSSGQHAASIQLLRNNSQPYIYLSFLVRFDYQYDATDAIVIALQDNHSSTAHPAGTRRIVIRPNSAGVGAGSAVPGADQTVQIPGAEDVLIRTNRDAVVDYGKLSGTSWASIGTPTGAAVKARSWRYTNNNRCWSVEVRLPTTKVAGGADWIDLSTTKFGLYCDIVAFNHAPEDPLWLGETVLQSSWPHKDVNGDSNVLTGDYLTLLDIPVDPKRMGEASLSGTGVGIGFDNGVAPGAVSVSIAGGAPGYNVDRSIEAGSSPAATKNNKFVAKIKNGGSTAANINAEFRIARFGIYRGDVDPATADSDGTWKRIEPDAAVANAGAQIQNPTPYQSVPAGGSFTFELDWKLNQAQATQMAGIDAHQCFAVYLGSNSNALFAEASTYRNTQFGDLSENGTSLTVSGRGHGEPTSAGGQHEFILKSCAVPMVSSGNYDGWYGKYDRGDNPDDGHPELKRKLARTPAARGAARLDREGDGDNPKVGLTTPWLAQGVFERWNQSRQVTTTWIVVTLGYRRTQDVLTIGKVPYTLYELVDTCGSVLSHDGDVALFRQSLEGPGLKRIGKDTYRLLVRPGDDVVLQARYEALEPGNLAVLERLLKRIDTLQVAIEGLDVSLRRVEVLHTLAHRLVRLIRLLPLPIELKKALVQLLETVSAVHERVHVVKDLRGTVDAIEHHIQTLDQLFDKLEAIGAVRVDELLAKFYPEEAPRLSLAIDALRSKVAGLVALLSVLDDVNVEVDQLDALVEETNLLLASLRGLTRTFEKVSSFGAGIETRFPLLDKLWPEAGHGSLRELIERISRDARELAAMPGALEHLAGSQKDLESRENQLDALEYAALVRVVDRIYREAVG